MLSNKIPKKTVNRLTDIIDGYQAIVQASIFLDKDLPEGDWKKINKALDKANKNLRKVYYRLDSLPK